MARPPAARGRAHALPAPYVRRAGPRVRAPKKKTASKQAARKAAARKTGTPALLARVNDQVTLDVYDNGKVGAFFDGYGVDIGRVSVGAVPRARELSQGLPFGSFSPAR